MTELMIKMTSWLVAAMLLGFMVAWFLSRILYNRKEHQIEDMFDSVIIERNNMIDKLEKDFRREREVFETVSNELKDTEDALAEKTSLLTTLQSKLNKDGSSENSMHKLQQENSRLSSKNQKLIEIDRQRIVELKSFEEVVLLAEEKVEEHEKLYYKMLEELNEEIDRLTVENDKHKESIKIYEKRINKLEKELKLYKAENTDPEFVISKDQFLAIEEQLKSYQKEINSLKNANTGLLLKLKKSDRKLKV